MSAFDPAPARPLPFRIANRFLDGWWSSRFANEPELVEEELKSAAVRKTGLTDFGDPWFRRPLRVLLRSLAEEANLNPVGRLVAHVYIVKLLRDRLWAERWFEKHPEIRRRPLAPPVVVVGPMRSGTTRLHRLLAADDRFAHLRLFETISPVPRPDRPDGNDPRPRLAALSLGLLHRANPSTAAVHPTGPMEPEEELGLLVSSAWGMKHEAQWRVPGYARWCEEEDATPAYAHMADLLRLTGWLRGEDPAKPWLLKTPQHMLDLPALLRVFPEARVIFTHRDPAAVVGSSCSLAWNQMTAQSDDIDPRWIGREWLRKTELKIARMAEARDGIAPDRMIDVHYDAMESDWRAVMRRIYAFLDLDIAPALPAMTDYMERSDRDHSFRAHHYRLDSFGLDAARVRQRFESYIRDFAVPAGALNGGRGDLVRRDPAPRRIAGIAASPS